MLNKAIVSWSSGNIKEIILGGKKKTNLHIQVLRNGIAKCVVQWVKIYVVSQAFLFDIYAFHWSWFKESIDKRLVQYTISKSVATEKVR